MNIGIIVYSLSGHTLSVAVKLQEALKAAGHTVNLERVESAGPIRPGRANVPLRARPDVTGYDALVFGGPVWGGLPASPMATYLEQLTSLEGKQMACLATGVFPAGWGRNQTLARMVEICESKGATVCGMGSVGWFSLSRKRQIAEVVSSLSQLF